MNTKSWWVATAIPGILATTLALTPDAFGASAPATSSAPVAARVASAPAVARTQTISLYPKTSAWTSARKKKKAHPRTPYLSITRRDTSFVKYDTSRLRGRHVASAALQLTVLKSSARSGGIVVRRTSPNWSAGKLTHRAARGLAGAVVSTQTPRPPARGSVKVPLTRFNTGGQVALRLSYSQKVLIGRYGRYGNAAPHLVLVLTSPRSVAGDDDNPPVTEPPPPTPTPVTPTVSPTPVTPTVSPTPTTPTTSPTPVPPLPTPTGSPTTTRKVFAHYFPPYVISQDNKPASSDYYTINYLSINGEGGKYASVGGLLRDRPIPRDPLAGSDWQLQDMRTEVREAKAAGLNGFTVNIMNTTGRNWDATVRLMQGAKDVGGFAVMPMVDTNGAIGSKSATEVADALAKLYAYSSAYKEGSEYLLSTFKAEGQTAAWWGAVIDRLENTYHYPIRFIASFLNASDANMSSFKSISYGFGNWGVRTVDAVTKAPNYAAKAHALGRKWMAAVSYQDARPNQLTYAEASNTATGRAMWSRANSDGADYVQVVTWNDYSESTQIAPSVAHGSVYADLTKYYADWYRNGAAPAITSDHLYLTSRAMTSTAKATQQSTTLSYKLGGMNTPPQDTVEGLVFLTSPADVTLTSGGVSSTFSLKAGISAVTVPLRTGGVSATLSRSSANLMSLTAPRTVTSAPATYDFQYFATGE